jgi:ankyrin repeat protein
MIKKYFTKGRDYFLLRNYKYETVFHVAARYNSLEALKALLGKSVFIEELLKKDFKGDTPMNIAATHCNIEILEFFVRSCT